MRDGEAPSFGAVLKRLRGTAGLTQAALAARASVSMEAISALERGFRKTPHPDTVALLADALKLSPSQRTDLEAAAFERKDAIERKHRGVGFGPGKPATDNLPHQASALVGRRAETEAITKALRANRLVTISGSGGIGKTRVALHVGMDLRDKYTDGVWFVDLAPLAESHMIPSAIASVLGVKLPADSDPLVALNTVLRPKHLLLILDNCEQVLDAAAAVAASILGSCPEVAVLATSRQGLSIAGEVTFRLPSLAVPKKSLIANLSAGKALVYGAIALFVKRAEDTGSGFVLTDANAPQVAEICLRLDGIALAIELAAAHLRMMSLPTLRARLDARFDLPMSGVRCAAPRHRTLRATFDWSYELLDEREREFFRGLGIFVDAFTLEAARAVCADGALDEMQVLELLAALVDKSLIHLEAEAETTRYRMLETTRAYAGQKLSACGERDRLAERHLTYFREIVESASSEIDETGRTAPFVSLMFEFEDIRAAMRWSLSGGDVLAGAALAASIGVRWQTFSLSAEGIRRIEEFIARVPDSKPALLARLWTWLAHFLGNTVRAAESLEASERGLRYAHIAADRRLLVEAMRAHAIFMARHGHFEQAEEALRESQALAGASPTPGQRISLLTARGQIARMRGDNESGIRAYDALRSLHHSLDDDFGEANAILDLAEMEHARGKTARAIALVQQARPLTAHVRSRELRANLLANLAGYLVAMDDRAGACVAAREAIALLAPAEPSSLFVAIALEHAALGLALGGELARGARLLGYCAAHHKDAAVQDQFTEQTTRDRLIAVLRKGLTESELETLMAEGAALGPLGAIQEATSAP